MKSMSKAKKLPASRFRWDNCALAVHYAQPWKWNDTFSEIKVEKDWKVLGWCRSDALQVRHKADLIAIMFLSPDNEEVWFHCTPIEQITGIPRP